MATKEQVVARLRSAYIKRAQRIQGQIERQNENTIRLTLRHMRGFRRQLFDQFAQVQTPTQLTELRFRQMQRITREETRKLENLLLQTANTGVDAQAELAKSAVQDPLLALGLGPQGSSTVSGAGVDPNLILAAKETSASLIRASDGGLAAEVLKRVNTTLQRGILGTQSLTTVLQELAQTLGDTSPLFTIAERIFRTESLTVSSLTQQAVARRIAEFIPMVKRWIRGISRPNHIAIDGQTATVRGKFRLRELQTGRLLRPDHPRDPALPPGERVNCACSVIVEPNFEAIDRFLVG